MHLVCHTCGNTYALEQNHSMCACHAPLSLNKYSNIDLKMLNNTMSGVFKYHHTMPYLKDLNLIKEISLGEGNTPLLTLDQTHRNILLKMDYLMPTGSFKDRGAAVLIAHAKALGVKHIIQDSSGNAGAAIAAYAARAEILCDIYVPEDTSQAKIKQIKSYGANIVVVNGNREATAKAALERALKDDVFYASHVYHPLFHEGTKTYAFEVFEQLGNRFPDAFIVPVGNGTLLLGIYAGIQTMLSSGYTNKTPKIIAIQTENCAPIYHKFHHIKQPFSSKKSIAEGIAIAKPKRMDQIIDAILKTSGTLLLAPENKLKYYHHWLAQKGFYVEPTTASNLAGYFENIELIGTELEVVIPLCGSGLKK